MFKSFKVIVKIVTPALIGLAFFAGPYSGIMYYEIKVVPFYNNWG